MHAGAPRVPPFQSTPPSFMPIPPSLSPETFILDISKKLSEEKWRFLETILSVYQRYLKEQNEKMFLLILKKACRIFLNPNNRIPEVNDYTSIHENLFQKHRIEALKAVYLRLQKKGEEETFFSNLRRCYFDLECLGSEERYHYFIKGLIDRFHAKNDEEIPSTNEKKEDLLPHPIPLLPTSEVSGSKPKSPSSKKRDNYVRELLNYKIDKKRFDAIPNAEKKELEEIYQKICKEIDWRLKIKKPKLFSSEQIKKVKYERHWENYLSENLHGQYVLWQTAIYLKKHLFPKMTHHDLRRYVILIGAKKIFTKINQLPNFYVLSLQNYPLETSSEIPLAEQKQLNEISKSICKIIDWDSKINKPKIYSSEAEKKACYQKNWKQYFSNHSYGQYILRQTATLLQSKLFPHLTLHDLRKYVILFGAKTIFTQINQFPNLENPIGKEAFIKAIPSVYQKLQLDGNDRAFSLNIKRLCRTFLKTRKEILTKEDYQKIKEIYLNKNRIGALRSVYLRYRQKGDLKTFFSNIKNHYFNLQYLGSEKRYDYFIKKLIKMIDSSNSLDTKDLSKSLQSLTPAKENAVNKSPLPISKSLPISNSPRLRNKYVEKLPNFRIAVEELEKIKEEEKEKLNKIAHSICSIIDWDLHIKHPQQFNSESAKIVKFQKNWSRYFLKHLKRQYVLWHTAVHLKETFTEISQHDLRRYVILIGAKNIREAVKNLKKPSQTKSTSTDGDEFKVIWNLSLAERLREELKAQN